MRVELVLNIGGGGVRSNRVWALPLQQLDTRSVLLLVVWRASTVQLAYCPRAALICRSSWCHEDNTAGVMGLFVSTKFCCYDHISLSLSQLLRKAAARSPEEATYLDLSGKNIGL